MPIGYEKRAKARIKRGLRGYIAKLQRAALQGITEEDTSSLLVHAVLVEMLRYEPLSEVNAEYKVKGQYADWVVRLGDELKFFVEVKSLRTKLRESHLAQVETYARRRPGVNWAVLTNGDEWQCHRISEGVESELFFKISLLDPSEAMDRKVHCLYLLSKEAVSRDLLQKDWDQAELYRPERLTRVLLSEDVLKAIRRIIRRDNRGRRVDIGVLKESLLRSVIRGDLPAEALRPAPVRRRRKRTKRQTAAHDEGGEQAQQAGEEATSPM